MTHTCTLAEWLRDGPALVATGVTRVALTDKRPYGRADGMYGWELDHGRWSRVYLIPAPLYRLLREDPRVRDKSDLYDLVEFADEQTANDAMSAALLSLATLMTPPPDVQAQMAYDEATPVMITEERIKEIVEYTTRDHSGQSSRIAG